ncbi:MAG: 50S ribosomal protein L3 [Thermoanaerobaculia bacterium]
MKGILGRKIGMTQIFSDAGEAVPVTVVQAGPCLVVQRKTVERDGYDAIQIGLVEARPPRKVTQPMRGHFERGEVAPMRRLAEFKIAADEEMKPGDQLKASIFEVDEYVDVVGRGKGKGFQGVMRRHGFGGGRATHGSMFHRAPGSVGQASDPSRVFPGVRLPGQMGAKRITAKNLKVIKVDEEKNLLFLRGAVPGPNSGYIAIQAAKRG